MGDMALLNRFKERYAPSKMIYPDEVYRNRNIEVLSERDIEMLIEKSRYYANIETKQCLISLRRKDKSEYPTEYSKVLAERMQNTLRNDLGIQDFWMVRHDQFDPIMKALRLGKTFDALNTRDFAM